MKTLGVNTNFCLNLITSDGFRVSSMDSLRLRTGAKFVSAKVKTD